MSAAGALVNRVWRLRETEELLRSEARVIELDPARQADAGALFRRASGLRRLRMELLDRWHLR